MHNHTEYVEGCFSCKLKTLQFAMVPGAYRATTSQSNYDSDALPDLPGREEVLDYRADLKHAPVKEMKYDHADGSLKEA